MELLSEMQGEVRGRLSLCDQFMLSLTCKDEFAKFDFMDTIGTLARTASMNQFKWLEKVYSTQLDYRACFSNSLLHPKSLLYFYIQTVVPIPIDFIDLADAAQGGNQKIMRSLYNRLIAKSNGLPLASMAVGLSELSLQAFKIFWFHTHRKMANLKPMQTLRLILHSGFPVKTECLDFLWAKKPERYTFSIGTIQGMISRAIQYARPNILKWIDEHISPIEIYFERATLNLAVFFFQYYTYTMGMESMNEFRRGNLTMIPVTRSQFEQNFLELFAFLARKNLIITAPRFDGIRFQCNELDLKLYTRLKAVAHPDQWKYFSKITIEVETKKAAEFRMLASEFTALGFKVAPNPIRPI